MLHWRRRDTSDGPWAHLILLTVLSASWLVTQLNLQTGLKCFFKKTVGLPCPTCGVTRQWHHMLDGDIIQAFFSNPGVAVAGSLLLAYLLVAIWGYHHGHIPVVIIKPIHALILMGMVGVNWAYLLITGL